MRAEELNHLEPGRWLRLTVEQSSNTLPGGTGSSWKKIMQTKHTPEEWAVKLNSNAGESWDVLARNGNLCVASCGTGDEALANARIIAAAPDLLAALEALLQTALKVSDKEWASAIDRASTFRPCDAARSAIAKATGQA